MMKIYSSQETGFQCTLFWNNGKNICLKQFSTGHSEKNPSCLNNQARRIVFYTKKRFQDVYSYIILWNNEKQIFIALH